MKRILTYVGIGLATALSSCDKEWLDVKSDISLIVPSTLQDVRLLLEHDKFNTGYTTIGEISSDDITLTTAAYQNSSLVNRSTYTWQKEIFSGPASVLQWDNNYNQIFTANVVLEQLEKIIPPASGQNDYNDLKGRALFFRGRAFYDLVALFARSYDPKTATSDLGIPLKLQSDIKAATTRASVEESYVQILKDLKEAAGLLKALPEHKTHPSRAAAFGYLARVSLAMGDYPAARQYAQDALLLYPDLIDYNTVNVAATAPFAAFNQESVFHSVQALNTVIPNSAVVPELYNSYLADDLRKAVFFKKNADGSYGFKGNYTGNTLLFGGISTNELYLIRAECKARLGDKDGAMDDLNRLLVKRFKAGTFIPYTAGDAAQALNLVLAERRKELVYRGMRWQDLRRLNLDPQFAKTLTRSVNNQTYTLPPNDPRYTFPIPEYVITAAGIQQNIR